MTYNTYSKRTKGIERLQIEQYCEIPEKLRNQIFNILNQEMRNIWRWKQLWNAFCDEEGEEVTNYEIQDPSTHEEEYYHSCCREKIKKGEIEKVFDLIDIAFQLAHETIDSAYEQGEPGEYYEESIKRASKKLNARFEEANVGYRLVNNQIERKILNLDLALPALDLLRDENFKHARNNFYLAHRSYQNKNYGECVVNASKSFEDLLKALCAQQELEHDPEGSTENLVKVLCEDLFSSSKFNKKFSQSFKFLPDVRAHFGGHGSAPEDKETPDFMARYALHLVATNILFFIQAVGPKKPSETEDETSTDETSSNNSGGGDLDDDIPF